MDETTPDAGEPQVGEHFTAMKDGAVMDATRLEESLPTLRELVTYVGEISGHRRPIVPLGPTLSMLQARVLAHYAVFRATRAGAGRGS